MSGKYRLNNLGCDACDLISRTVAYTRSNVLKGDHRRQLPVVIIVKAVLWAASVRVVVEFEGGPHLGTEIGFTSLWFFGNILLYSVLKRIGPAYMSLWYSVLEISDHGI